MYYGRQHYLCEERIVIANDDFSDAAISKDRRPGNENKFFRLC